MFTVCARPVCLLNVLDHEMIIEEADKPKRIGQLDLQGLQGALSGMAPQPSANPFTKRLQANHACTVMEKDRRIE